MATQLVFGPLSWLERPDLGPWARPPRSWLQPLDDGDVALCCLLRIIRGSHSTSQSPVFAAAVNSRANDRCAQAQAHQSIGLARTGKPSGHKPRGCIGSFRGLNHTSADRIADPAMCTSHANGTASADWNLADWISRLGPWPCLPLPAVSLRLRWISARRRARRQSGAARAGRIRSIRAAPATDSRPPDP